MLLLSIPIALFRYYCKLADNSGGEQLFFPFTSYFQQTLLINRPLYVYSLRNTCTYILITTNTTNKKLHGSKQPTYSSTITHFCLQNLAMIDHSIYRDAISLELKYTHHQMFQFKYVFVICKSNRYIFLALSHYITCVLLIFLCLMSCCCKLFLIT